MGYGIIFCAALLWPLANYADAPAQRADQTRFVDPPAHAKTFLVQEAQSAYFYPHLLYISTEGLITLETFLAHQKGQSLFEFIMEYRPDLISHGRYYLRDPEALQAKINEALYAGKDLRLPGVHLEYAGVMKGAGPFFIAHYD